MSTRSTNYLRTRSGKRYRRQLENQNDETTSQSNKKRRLTTSQVSSTVVPQKSTATLTIYHPNNEVEVMEVPFEEWQTKVKKMLKEKLHMTEEELEEFPFWKWFQNDTEPNKIMKHIQREFFGDEDEFYLEPFQSWQREVDNLLYHKLGMRRLDLPDFPFYDHFHSMDTPLDMFNHIYNEIYL